MSVLKVVTRFIDDFYSSPVKDKNASIKKSALENKNRAFKRVSFREIFGPVLHEREEVPCDSINSTACLLSCT